MPGWISIAGGLGLATGGQREMMNELLKMEDIQKILLISKTNAYILVHRKDFPMIRIGRSIRVSRVALERWIEQQVVDGNGGGGR